MMKNVWIIIALASLMVGWTGEACAAERGKKSGVTVKKASSTPYEKLFKGKKCVTADGGWMTLRLVEGKVYGELPVSWLEKDLLLTSSIEYTSNNGEGVVGQFAGAPLRLRFVRRDSVVQVRTFVGKDHVADVPGNMSDAFRNANAGGIYKLLKVAAMTPDEGAVVLDLTELYIEHSNYTNPFSAYAGNSMYGFVNRIHKFKKERSTICSVRSYEDNVVVTCDLGYDVDHLVFGQFYMQRDMPVSVVVNKMLGPLPEVAMRPRLADPRVGVQVIDKPSVEGEKGTLKPIYYAKRWRVEPSDAEAYRRGQVVEPKKPIVFYLDSLIPATWKKYIRAGAEEWNLAFEKIGFRNVIRVVDYPKNDSSFDAKNIRNSTIVYSPLWMYTPQTSMCVDPRTGEILNASIYIHANTPYALAENRTICTMGSDPRVRGTLAEEEVGELLRSHMTQYVGRCIGFENNYGSSYAYPVDSLRSATFTKTYGLTPSIMDDLTCNFIAQPQDVAQGVRMTPKGVGPYDYFAVKWLYQPIAGEERAVLDGWIRESEKEPMYRYGKRQHFFALYDPTAMYYDLGDDPVKANRYFCENLKRSVANFMEWFVEGDEDLLKREALYDNLIYYFARLRWCLASPIGGFYTREPAVGSHTPAYVPVPKAKQKEAMAYLFELANDVSWMNRDDLLDIFPLGSKKAGDLQKLFFGEVLNRLGHVMLCAGKTTRDAYTPEEFMNDVYAEAWKNARGGQTLSNEEMANQRSFLMSLIKKSTATASASAFGEMPKQEAFCLTRDMSKCRAVLESRVETYVPAGYDVSRVTPVEVMGDETAGYFPLLVNLKGLPSMVSYYYDLLIKTRSLLDEMVKTNTGDTRGHYEFLLFTVDKALSDEK